MDNLQDEYKTVKTPVSGIFREKGSKFIAYAFETESEFQFKTTLDAVIKDHFKARHHCFAYLLGPNGNNFRYNDDGEPAGTAGIPIYNQIRSHELYNTGIVVVRYFGGTKLGVPGLINAYKSAAKDAIDNAEIIIKYIEKTIEIQYTYDQTGDIMNLINAGGYKIISNEYDPYPKLLLKVRASKTSELNKQILASLLKRNFSDIDGNEIIEGLKINIYA
ncbi:MAG: IMPACT family protein [Deltaproteobacteria bacterium]